MSSKGWPPFQPVGLKVNDWDDLSGRVSFLIVIAPRWVFVNVQVTVSPAATSIAVMGLPSSQVAEVGSQPREPFSTTE